MSSTTTDKAEPKDSQPADAEAAAPAAEVVQALDPAMLAAIAAAARAAHDAATRAVREAPSDDPRVREIDGGTITLCPGGILVYSQHGGGDQAPEAAFLDAVLGKQCTGVKADGTRCKRSAGSDGTCGQNHASSVTS